MTGKRVVIQTLGCKLNFAESAAMMQQLEKAGYRQVPMGQAADVCLVNTCSVTGTADQKDRQAIHRIIREYPEAFVIVSGCYAQLRPQEVAAIPGVSLVVGADFKTDLLPYIQEGRQEAARILTTANQDIARFLPACARGDRTRCFLKVQDGCDYFCSYCTVPFARGRSRNPSIDSLVEQARQAAAQGAKEIVLTGVNIGTFGRSDGSNFLQLIEALDRVEGIERYRISSLEPDLLSDDIIRFVASSRRFAPHFHLPLQSGDDEVLALMRRHYRRELFAQRVACIKEVMPQAFIGVDVIVGMRGETPERFASSAEFLAGLPISQLHVFSYSERPGTQALKIDHKVSEAEKKRRSDLLHALSEEKRLAFYRSQTGRPLRVLFEHGNKKGLMSGFSENYVRVEVPFRADWENTVQTITTGPLNPAGSALSI
ncbi:MAG: tRNA (N(6)-L-threonylcarbamoyladenosine(37)-C(2))-methylthiotransferase MtaB [Bacteroidales bacterium]|nr:tRNA (N(6)-L-threonylcarbamoyladenosine(37)-C(2))-methylthiotransferase MtaB [Bacteroidales bacterium]